MLVAGLGDMLYFNIMPLFVEVFSNEAMAMVGLFLAAQQAPAVQYLAGVWRARMRSDRETATVP